VDENSVIQNWITATVVVASPCDVWKLW